MTDVAEADGVDMNDVITSTYRDDSQDHPRHLDDDVTQQRNNDSRTSSQSQTTMSQQNSK